jgi:hypothetical protein
MKSDFSIKIILRARFKVVLKILSRGTPEKRAFPALFPAREG